MKIKHDPFFKTEEIERIYSEKDGVPVKYVCTTALKADNAPLDIFYRETPHPEFGNRYFGIINQGGKNYITNADTVEDYSFAMVDVDGEYHYSRYRHDCKIFKNADGKTVMIDGGRAYTRATGPTRRYKVVDGEFVEFEEEGYE